MIMVIDDFDLILGNNFFVSASVGVFPHLGGVMVMYRGNACFIHGQSKPTEVEDSKDGERQLAVL